MDHNKLWNILERWEYQADHLTCLLRNLYSGQETIVGAGHGIIDWFKIGKGMRQGCLFNLYTEHIIGNAGLDGSRGGIKIARRNINDNMLMIPL